MANHDGYKPGTQFEKLIAGVRNNNPEFLPKIGMSANAKKRALPNYNFSFPPNEPVAKAPIVELPDQNRHAFEAFERRLTCALYYRHMDEIMPLTHMIRTHRLQVIEKSAETLIREIAPMLPNGVMTKRQNTDIGDQFYYFWYASAETKMFVFLAQFAKSFVFVGAACRSQDVAGGENYRAHSEDFES